MKPIRVIQATPKAKTKILSQKRKTPDDSKGKTSQKAKKRRLETSSDSEDYDENCKPSIQLLIHNNYLL